MGGEGGREVGVCVNQELKVFLKEHNGIVQY